MSNPFKERAHQRDAQRALYEALRQRDEAKVQQALDQGAVLRGKDDRGTPVLHLLLDFPDKDSSCERMRQAIAAGAGMEEQPRDDGSPRAFPFTALLKAAWNGSTAQVQLLLEQGASIKAVSGKDLAGVMGQDDMPRWDGSTAVHLACHQLDSQVLQVLLDAGGRVDVADRQGRLPLHAALLSGRRLRSAEREVTTVTRLLAAGADPNAPVRGKRREATAVGDRPLHLAADRPMAHDVVALLNAGADPTVLDAQGRTPLQRAQQQNLPDPMVIAALERVELTLVAPPVDSVNGQAPRRRL